MVIKDPELEKNLKSSFSKVKDHMNSLETELNKIITELNDQRKSFDDLRGQIIFLTSKIDNLSKNKPSSIETSSGNNGVLTTNKQQTNNKQTTNKQQTSVLTILKEEIEPIKEDIEKKFLSLTNLEFSLFTAIYQLEEELNRSVQYTELAERLKISQSFVRGMIRELMLKKIPIIKHKDRNRKVSLSIPKEFKNLNLMANLAKFRDFDYKQTTLFRY